MEFVMILVLLGCVCCMGVLWLQWKLSCLCATWPGLVMPTLCFAAALFVVLGMTAFSFQTEIRAESIVQDGTVREVQAQEVKTTQTSHTPITVLMLFLTQNIPTVLLMLIYVVARQKKRGRDNLKRMNIQDLK